MDEEQKTIQLLPPRLSMKTPQQFYEFNSNLSPARPSSVSTIQLSPPRSPHSPWTVTPLHSLLSPTLLYHCVATLHRREGNVFSIAVSRGIIFTGSESSRIRIWKQPECIERGCLRTSSGEVRAILVHGNMLFTTHKDYKIRIWKVSAGSDNFQPKKITSLPRNNSFLSFRRTNPHQHHKDYISCIAYYHTEGLLYTGSWDRTVKAWKVSDKKCIDSFIAHEDNINVMLVNQEDGCLFTCSSDGSVKIWRKVFGENSHRHILTLRNQTSPVNALALSSSLGSLYLYSGSSDGSINYWEKERVSGRFNHGGFLQGHRFSVLCMVSIERLVLSGSEDATIRVWRREEDNGSHQCLAVLEGHRGPVKCLVASMEMEKVVVGFLVYSASLDRTVKVWRVKIFPVENEANVNEIREEKHCQKMGFMECEMSPAALSPLWVEKKFHDKNLH